MTVRSALGHPFDAEIQLIGWDEKSERPRVVPVESLRVRLAGGEERVWPTAWLDTSRAGNTVVRVRTEFEISEPAFELKLRIDSDRGRMFVTYPVTLRPPLIGSARPADEIRVVGALVSSSVDRDAPALRIESTNSSLLATELEESRRRQRELEASLAQVTKDRERLAAEAKERERQASAAKDREAAEIRERERRQQPAAPARVEKRVALVIGNSNYTFNRLDNPINDAADMAAALRSLNFEVTLLRDATLAQMRAATRVFEEAVTGADVALIFYAGHGTEAKGRNFMIPVNADIKREFELEDQAYNASQWLDMLEGAKGRNAQRVNIVILDACRDNTLTRSWRNTAGGLARMDAPSGTILVYSTAPGKVAADGAAGQRNSPFTKHFLQAIQTANTPIELVLRETRRRVVAETKGEQVPWEHSSLVGEFVFRLQR